jgi:hypothetical protein
MPVFSPTFLVFRPVDQSAYSQMERPNLKWTRATGPDGRQSEICFRYFSSTSSHDGKAQDDVKQQQFNSEMLEGDDDLNDTLFNVVEDPSSPKLKFLCNLTLPW